MFGTGVAPDDKGSKIISAFIRIVWVFPLLGAAYSSVYFLSSWDAQKSAPQQAALAGYSIALAVLPYCLARAITSIIGKPQA